ncbi:MAG: Crp/Fnr family transcriptional regulator [Candidatus Abyssubacteria bacterium]
MSDTAHIVKELKRIPFLSDLNDAPLKELARAARQKTYEKGQMVFFENDPCDGFYFISNGSVKIYKMSSSGREQILHTLTTGETFGEVPTFDNGLCPAYAQALEDSTLLLIKRTDFENVVRRHPEVALGLLHHFARWLRRFTMKLEELSLKDVSERLANYLLRVADESGTKTPEGIEVRLKESQQEIAARIGTVREIVSRTLRKFQDSGFIRLKGRRLIILDRERLNKMA